MKRFSAPVALLLTALAVSGNSFGQDDPVIPDGPYLGQKPPGAMAEVFAPGIVNTAATIDKEGMFAADMNSFYFVRADGEDKPRKLMAIENKNNRWQQSVVLEGETEASFSPDGKTVYFQTNYMERTSTGWSALKSLGAPFKDLLIMRVSPSSSGTLYFDTYSKELDVPLRYSRLKDGKYEQPKSLGDQFAIGTYNAHPFVAPDETYIIWDSRRDGGYGTSDLYISFRAADGSWGPALNMGDKINTTDAENYPSVSPDGKFVFFDRRTGSGSNRKVAIYWVDAQIIEDLRPKE